MFDQSSVFFFFFHFLLVEMMSDTRLWLLIVLVVFVLCDPFCVVLAASTKRWSAGSLVEASKSKSDFKSPCSGLLFGSTDVDQPLLRTNLVAVFKDMELVPEGRKKAISWPWKKENQQQQQQEEEEVEKVQDHHWIAFSSQQLLHLSFYGCYNGTLAKAIESPTKNEGSEKEKKSSMNPGASDFTPVVIAQQGHDLASFAKDQLNLPCAVFASKSLKKHLGLKDGDRIQLGMLVNVIRSPIPSSPKVNIAKGDSVFNVYCKERDKELPAQKLHGLHRPKSLILPVTAFVEGISDDQRHRIYFTHTQLSNMGIEPPFDDWRLEALAKDPKTPELAKPERPVDDQHDQHEGSPDGVVIVKAERKTEAKEKTKRSRRLVVQGVETHLWVEGSEEANQIVAHMERSVQIKRRAPYHWEEGGGGVVVSASVAKALNLKQGDHFILYETQSPHMRMLQKALKNRDHIQFV